MRTNVYAGLAEADTAHATALLERLRAPVTGLLLQEPVSPKGRFHDPAANAVRQLLEARIREADVLACLVGPEAHLSPWLRWEIETAVATGRGIVAIRLRSGIGDFMPNALSGTGAQIVDSHVGSVIASLQRAAFTSRMRRQENK